jgi:hypothetical protein
VRSLYGLEKGVTDGFQPSHALVVMISVPSQEDYVAILDDLRAIPGVEAVGSPG